MRRLDIVIGPALLTATGILSGCRAPDLGQTYVNWTTRVNPTVECNKQGQPNIKVDFSTLASNTEKVVLKATSETSGRSVEQVLNSDDIKGKEITGSRRFRNYKYNLRGDREEVPIPAGDIVTLRVYGVDRIENTDGEIIHVRPLTKAIKIQADCVPSSNRLND